MQPALPSHLTQNWRITKPAAYGRKGLVVAQAKTAAQAGAAILDAGGNAVDAAVATALALAAVEPWNSGLGGIGFAVVHRAGQPAAEVVDFGPVAPAALDAARFRLTGRMKQDLFPWPGVEGDVNVHGPLSFAIPSAPSGYKFLHMSWGRLPFAEIIAPAIALARRGLPQDWLTTLKIANAAAVLRRYPESARIYLPDGLPPVPPYQGTPGFMLLGRLADTLEQLQRAGLDDFYRGEVAASIAADLRDMGAALCAEDLAACEARAMPAMEVPWRGRVLQLSGGLTAAPTLARVLGAMEGVRYPGAPDAAWFRTLARAMRQAYAERLSGLGDAALEPPETCTTHLSAIDAQGTMVSLTSTLLSSMGSRVVLPRSGVLMNNGVMWFDPRPGRANSIGPRRRPLTNMLPVILKDGHRPVIAAGASGGRRIMAAVFQLLTFVADFGMDLEIAAHHPRIDVSGPDGASVDQRLGPDISAALAGDGPVQTVEHTTLPINFACPNLIIRRDNGSRGGISDALSPWSAAVAQS